MKRTKRITFLVRINIDQLITSDTVGTVKVYHNPNDLKEIEQLKTELAESDLNCQIDCDVVIANEKIIEQALEHNKTQKTTVRNTFYDHTKDKTRYIMIEPSEFYKIFDKFGDILEGKQ